MTLDLQPTLTGPRVSLRPARRSDLDPLHAAASDPLIWAQHPDSLRWQREVFEPLFDTLLASGGALVILDRSSGDIIGTSSFYDLDPADRSVSIGFTFLTRRYWGGSYNAEVKQLMIDHAFTDVDRVWFHVGPQNRRSQRAMEKIGARLSHEAERHIGGVTTRFLHYVIERPR